MDDYDEDIPLYVIALKNYHREELAKFPREEPNILEYEKLKMTKFPKRKTNYTDVDKKDDDQNYEDDVESEDDCGEDEDNLDDEDYYEENYYMKLNNEEQEEDCEDANDFFNNIITDWKHEKSSYSEKSRKTMDKTTDTYDLPFSNPSFLLDKSTQYNYDDSKLLNNKTEIDGDYIDKNKEPPNHGFSVEGKDKVSLTTNAEYKIVLNLNAPSEIRVNYKHNSCPQIIMRNFVDETLHPEDQKYIVDFYNRLNKMCNKFYQDSEMMVVAAIKKMEEERRNNEIILQLQNVTTETESSPMPDKNLSCSESNLCNEVVVGDINESSIDEKKDFLSQDDGYIKMYEIESVSSNEDLERNVDDSMINEKEDLLKQDNDCIKSASSNDFLERNIDDSMINDKEDFLKQDDDSIKSFCSDEKLMINIKETFTTEKNDLLKQDDGFIKSHEIESNMKIDSIEANSKKEPEMTDKKPESSRKEAEKLKNVEKKKKKNKVLRFFTRLFRPKKH